ncbi:hypothetical protein ACOI9X_22730 [Pseudomonas sp. P2757]|uniref:hypothetical protein n=1 Tax=unclassified Pseudomonas TaxID=196821 RepID=UPI003B5AF26E
MPTESEEGRRIVASLALRVDHIADIDQVAGAIITLLHDTSAALVPVIGPIGVAALFRRSLNLCTSAQPRLADISRRLADPLDMEDFKSVLVQQNRTDVIFFGEEWLKALYALLATLIGNSLCARLLLDVWDINSSAPPAQEISP